MVKIIEREDCSHCSGSGDCSNCDGEGEIRFEGDWVSSTCVKCSGSGKCSGCGGSGTHDEPHEPSPWTEY